jgi:hypothetical protein
MYTRWTGNVQYLKGGVQWDGAMLDRSSNLGWVHAGQQARILHSHQFIIAGQQGNKYRTVPSVAFYDPWIRDG